MLKDEGNFKGTSHHVVIGNLRSYNGNCRENVTKKLNFALSQVYCDYSTLITLYKIGKLHFRLLGTMVFMQRQRVKDLLL